MVRLCTSGRPELIMVANWRVKITISRVLTPVPIVIEMSFALLLTEIGRRRWRCRNPTTSSRFERSISPVRISPVALRALYWKTGIGTRD